MTRAATILVFALFFASGPPADAAPETVEIAPGERLEGRLGAGESRDFRLPPGLGEVLVSVEEQGVDLVVEGLGPGGERRVAVDSPTGDYGLETLFLPGSSQSRALRLVPASADADPGLYVLRLERLPENALERRAAARTLSLAGELFLAGDAGSKERAAELYRLDLTAGDLERARPCFEEALELFEALGKTGYVAGLYNNLGGVEDLLGEPDRALDRYGRALELRRELDDRAGEAETLNNMGVIYRVFGQWQRARRAFARTRGKAPFIMAADRGPGAASARSRCRTRRGDRPRDRVLALRAGRNRGRAKAP